MIFKIIIIFAWVHCQLLEEPVCLLVALAPVCVGSWALVPTPLPVSPWWLEKPLTHVPGLYEDRW